MRQEYTFFSVVRAWALLLFGISVALSKIQNNMSKDEVLNIIGSPQRTERIDGKDKWAYRYWIGDDHNVEALRQVTFYDGHVVSFGEDTEEETRIKDIQADDQKREQKRRLAKEKSLSPEKAADQAPIVEVQQSDPPAKPVIEEDFVEQKGKHAPVTPNTEE
jgi:outer membrane protein assembly factor BamE (lipoprotein component of BamABCDE complex)